MRALVGAALAAGGLVAVALAACGRDDAAQGPGAGPRPRASVVARRAVPGEAALGPYPREQFYIDHDLFLAADEPRTVPAREAGFLKPGDDVLGLVVAGRARAYAVTMLSYHHVINDVIAGTPVAVTY
jgi:hypothetical protein